MTHAPFPPAVRLRQSQAFRSVFRDGRRYVRSGLVVIAHHTAHDSARLGLAIAKRRVPRAVDRNRIKRVIRESFRSRRARLGPLDVVVLARNATGRMSNQRLFSQLDSVWLEVQAQRKPNRVHKAEHNRL